MDKLTAFLSIDRIEPDYQPVDDRLAHFHEFTLAPDSQTLGAQAMRCMDCGVPYCHTGCPVNNRIPDWNALVFENEWRAAAQDLHDTNNFPEFTGRTCPAPCEEACTLNLIDKPVTIKMIENAIVERAFEEAWVQPKPCDSPSGRSVAIVGAGPAGLAAAQQLARQGHRVTLFDREPKPGGLLRYGIPDFKMEKDLIDRRFKQLLAEGIRFNGNFNLLSKDQLLSLKRNHHALILACGAEKPRLCGLENSRINGVHFAMDYLVHQNRITAREIPEHDPRFNAKDKNVIVIGGGDTASDCIGTALRQGAASVTQVDIRPQPPEIENKATTWPMWAVKMRTSTSQAEGAQRLFSTASLQVKSENSEATAIRFAKVDDKRSPLAGSDFEAPADLILTAIGFSGAADLPFLNDANITMNDNHTVKADPFSFRTNLEGIYAAGDMRRGQSLVVWAIREGRDVARAVHRDLTCEGTSRAQNHLSA